jgi:hypothetical protein
MCVFRSGGSAGHVVHFDASGPQNIDTLFFMRGWALCGVNKMLTVSHYTELLLFAFGRICGSRSAFQCIMPRSIDALFSCSGGSGTVSIKSALGYISLNLCFCSSGPSTDSIKSVANKLRQLVFLHLVGSVGHVVHSSASEA